MDELIKRFWYFKGYQDGLHGLALSILQAFYEFIVVLKAWELNGFPDSKSQLDPARVLQEIESETKHWQWWKWEDKIQQTSNRLKRFFLKAFRKLEIL